MHKVLHLIDEWHRQAIYVKKRRGRGLASIENGVDASMTRFGGFIKKSKRRLKTAASNSIDNEQNKN